MIMMMMMMICN